MKNPRPGREQLQERKVVCSLLLILLSSATSVDLLRREGLLPVCWIWSFLGFFVGLGMSCPAGSNRSESCDADGNVHAQICCAAPGTCPKTSQRICFHGVADGNASFQTNPIPAASSTFPGWRRIPQRCRGWSFMPEVSAAIGGFAALRACSSSAQHLWDPSLAAGQHPERVCGDLQCCGCWVSSGDAAAFQG